MTQSRLEPLWLDSGDSSQPDPQSWQVSGTQSQPSRKSWQLAYVSGDTKIIFVDRNIKLSAFTSKLTSFCDTLNAVVCFKYQVPDKDLDAFISVTNDKYLDHMIIEYDRFYLSFAKPARLMLLFPFRNNPPLALAPMRPSWSASGSSKL
ncbi:hypothetical protein L3X38_018757 [Prunus dulcis]|uniref:PB1 domain-containing protein n=1 Tax=Prunus dulcis TaxID=3755 RepID=A0AAD4W9M3_PRUDU|nr:hypothetical protein L3X38_018757 [Prunus dulcis]